MREASSWTMPDDLIVQVERLWERGEILSSFVSGEAMFPRRLVLKSPSASDLRDRFGEVGAWIQKIRKTPYCRIVMREVRHRVMGANFLPGEIWIDSVEDALKMIAKQKEANRFLDLLNATHQRQPILAEWLARHPLRALEHYAEWERFLEITAWMQTHPLPRLYLRQVDIPGAHSKFIEAHRGILTELFDIVLPSNAIDDTATGASQFEKRYGFLGKAQRIRFRLLDPHITVLPGASSPDLSLDAKSFAEIDPGISRVFITENEINYLAFPNAENSMVLFGAGYGFEMLRGVEWLSKSTIYYWGDIDTHGFAILDQLRGQLDCVQSLLMDRETLFAFQSQWGREEKQALHDLARLTPRERELYDALRENRIQMNLRLEQERIGYSRVKEAIRALV